MGFREVGEMAAWRRWPRPGPPRPSEAPLAVQSPPPGKAAAGRVGRAG